MFDAMADGVVVTVAEAREHAFDVYIGFGAQAVHDAGDERAVSCGTIDDPCALGRRRVIVGFVLVVNDALRIGPPGIPQDDAVAAQQRVSRAGGRTVGCGAESGVEDEVPPDVVDRRAPTRPKP